MESSALFKPVRTSSPLPDLMRADDSVSRRSSSVIWIDDGGEPIHRRRACRRRARRTIVVVAISSLLVGAYYAGDRMASRPLELRLVEATSDRNELLSRQKEMLTKNAELQRHSKEYKELSSQLETLKEELADYKGGSKALHSPLQTSGTAVLEALEDYRRQTINLENLQRKDDLSNFIKTLAYDRYGPGPHTVQFDVRIWTESRYEDASFAVQMATFEQLPASTFLFLEQVDRGLWDGTSFYMNAPHMLLAHPVSGSRDAYRLPQMESLGLARLPFPEYNTGMPHDKYTLGFGAASSTAGSFFFINKTNNASTQSGQPCFGKVVSGFDVIDRITALNTDRTTYHIQPVDITSARLLE